MWSGSLRLRLRLAPSAHTLTTQLTQRHCESKPTLDRQHYALRTRFCCLQSTPEPEDAAEATQTPEDKASFLRTLDPKSLPILVIFGTKDSIS
ncbi:hypothetical protein OJAV_G00229990 [Oryzias javanicus]|uniref:Uncharacterized protein n=1 Tax=Oryzias javanicus TaxID=123683 RepID=A0A437C0F7_ORYJA|nr:hypothetical protein OJAV_G00229990 [Oryzias javanicus]